MVNLTDRQLEVLRVIGRAVANGVPPTLREIGRKTGIASTSAVNDHLRCLERKGYIFRDSAISRGIHLTPKGSSAVNVVVSDARVALLERCYEAALRFQVSSSDDAESALKALDEAIESVRYFDRKAS